MGDNARFYSLRFLESHFAQSCILTKFCPMWKTQVFGLIIFMGFNTIYNRTYSVEWVNVQFHSLSSLVKHPRLFAQSCISSNNGNRAVINITDCCTSIIFFGKMNDFTALGFLLKSFSTNLHFDKILSSYIYSCDIAWPSKGLVIYISDQLL